MNISRKMAVRHGANLLAIVTGLLLIAWSIWPGGHTASNTAAWEMQYPSAMWATRAGTGVVAIMAVWLAQTRRRRRTARILLRVAALVWLLWLVVFQDFGSRALLFVLLPSVALFLASLGIGSMQDTNGVAR